MKTSAAVLKWAYPTGTEIITEQNQVDTPQLKDLRLLHMAPLGAKGSLRQRQHRTFRIDCLAAEGSKIMLTAR